VRLYPEVRFTPSAAAAGDDDNDDDGARGTIRVTIGAPLVLPADTTACLCLPFVYPIPPQGEPPPSLWKVGPGRLTREVETPSTSNSPHCPYDIESGPGGLTREVETPLPSNSPHDPMILRVDLVGSHGRWKRPRLQTSPNDDQLMP
jgi:hypothetical protein